MAALYGLTIAEDELVGNIATEIRRGGPEVIEGIADAWRGLWGQVCEDPFYRPEWILAYLQSFTTKPLVWLVTAFIGDQLVAVLPLVKEVTLFRGIPVRQLRAAANVHSCRFDMLRAQGKLGIAATQAIWRTLEHSRGWDLIQMPFTPADANAVDLLQHAEEAGFPTARDAASRSRYIKIRNCRDGKLESDPPLSPHFRHELRRFARRLEETLGAPCELVVVRDADPDLLQKFYQVEASGWKGREGTAIQSSTDTKAFYERAACIGARFGCFRLALLQANGRVIAGAFSMVAGKTLLPLKIGYDEALSRGAPGHLLFEMILKDCSKEGILEMECGGEDEHYKRLWTPLTRDYLRLYIFRRGGYGQLLRFHKSAIVPRFKRLLLQSGKFFRAAIKGNRDP